MQRRKTARVRLTGRTHGIGSDVVTFAYYSIPENHFSTLDDSAALYHAPAREAWKNYSMLQEAVRLTLFEKTDSATEQRRSLAALAGWLAKHFSSLRVVINGLEHKNPITLRI